MVSFVQLLRVAARLVQNPQPFFTDVHASFLLRAVADCPRKSRSLDDTKVMMNMIIHCPHVSTVFQNNPNVVRRTMTTFLIDDKLAYNYEVELLFREVIQKASVSNDLPVALMIAMVNRLNSLKVGSQGTAKQAFSLDAYWVTTEKLLNCIVSRLPRDRIISTKGNGSWSPNAKEIHKKKSMHIEKAELYFLITVLRNVSIAFRDNSIAKGSRSDGTISVAADLPETIVRPIIQSLTSLPAFRDTDSPMGFDDWICIIYLIGSGDARLHQMGKEAWLRKVHLLDVNAADMDHAVIFSIMVKMLGSLSESVKLDVLEMWLDFLSLPELISPANRFLKQMCLFELSVYYKKRSTTDAAKKALLTASQVLDALETDSTTEKDRIYALECRLQFSMYFPFLKKPEELQKTFSKVNEILLHSDNKRDALRAVADFLRFAFNVLDASVHDVTTTACNMLEVARQLLSTLPQFDETHTVALGVVSITCNSLIRSQHKHDDRVEDHPHWSALRQTMHLFVDDFIHHPTAPEWSLGVVGVLQMMELLGLASEARYATPVRAAVLGVLRRVSSAAEDANPYLAHRCYDILLRSIHFHVADAEVLAAASGALKRVTSAAALRGMAWDHRQLMLERAALVYRALVPLLSARGEARRLARHVTAAAAAVAAERADGPRRALSRREVRARRRCACYMWALAVRATVNPVPRALVDRHVMAMLSFTRRHWVSERVRTNEAERGVDEEFNRDLFDWLTPSLHRFFVLAFSQRAAFLVNLRRNKLVISTACEVLWLNRAVLSPRLWYSVQGVLTLLPGILSEHCTPRQLEVVRIALEQTLRNAQACENRGTWHLAFPEVKKKDNSIDEKQVILGPRELGRIFTCAELISDTSLRAYLITLLAEQIALMGDEKETSSGESTASLANPETLRKQCFKKVISTIRHGTVLYY